MNLLENSQSFYNQALDLSSPILLRFFGQLAVQGNNPFLEI